MRSAKHCALFYALAAIPPSMYAVFRRLAPYRPILVFLLVSFIISTLVLLWVGPYRFLIGSVPRNTRHHEAKTIQWSYLLTIGSYLVASGAFVEFLCGQEGGDRIIALDSKDNAQAFMSVRIWLTQLALSFITIGILEPIRQKRADIQPCFTELFPRLPCFQVQARWILFSLYSASFAMFTLFLLVVLVDAVLEKIYGPNVRMSIIFDICSSRVDRPLIVPALAFSLMDLAETVFYLAHTRWVSGLLPPNYDMMTFSPEEEVLMPFRGVSVADIVRVWCQTAAWFYIVHWGRSCS